jgi:phosphoribosylglycinamide formyltransferase-1
VTRAIAGATVNLLASLNDPRFAGREVHHALEALDRDGVRVERFHRTPERVLSWIDAEFGGSWAPEAALGGAYIASDANGIAGFAAYDPRGLEFSWLQRWKSQPDVGIFGPFGVAKRARGTGVGLVLLHGGLFSLRERGYARALIPAVTGDRLIAYYERHAGAGVVDRYDLAPPARRFRTVVLASGNGSNFQAVIDAARDGTLPLDITSLVVNRDDAFARKRALAAGIEVRDAVWNRKTTSRADYDARLLEIVTAERPDLVLLLGWMHVLPAAFVERFRQSINIHPAFLPVDPALDCVTMPDGTQLPAFRGARAFDDALRAELGWSGVSVHRLSIDVDRGSILARAPLALSATQSDEEARAMLHALEHRVLVAAIRRWVFEQPVRTEDSDPQIA